MELSLSRQSLIFRIPQNPYRPHENRARHRKVLAFVISVFRSRLFPPMRVVFFVCFYAMEGTYLTLKMNKASRRKPNSQPAFLLLDGRGTKEESAKIRNEIKVEKCLSLKQRRLLEYLLLPSSITQNSHHPHRLLSSLVCHFFMQMIISIHELEKVYRHPAKRKNVKI